LPLAKQHPVAVSGGSSLDSSLNLLQHGLEII
jgi:hypothetical protein